MTAPAPAPGDPPPFVPLVVHAVTGDDRVTLRAVGEVDPSTVALLADALEAAAATDTPTIELDCTELRFLDSAGVGLLATTQRAYEAGAGPRLVVTNVSGIVARVLEISGVGERLELGD